MPAAGDVCRGLIKARNLSSIVRRDFMGGRIYFNKPQQSQQTVTSFQPLVDKVTGLSEKICSIPNEPVGPGATKTSDDYKNAEYFCYNNMSYVDAEIEMSKYRCPQPSNKVKWVQ